MGRLSGKSKVKGKVNYRFAIICHYMTSIANGDRKKETWEKFHSYHCSEEITPIIARKLIKEHNLVLVLDNQYGKIWDRL